MTRTARPIILRLESLEDRSVPATLNVTTTLDVIDAADGKRSLREAITAANNLAGADVIVLPAGVYKLALAGADEDANATGDFDILDALTIQGAGKGKTIIDGQQLDRDFDVLGTAPSSIRVVLEKLTVRNGLVTGPGGGIRVGNADLVVRDCVVTGNRASESGGGISNVPGTANVTLARTTVGRNVAGSGGGGISATGISVLTVKDTTIRRNIAGVNGGGIFADTATLINSTISGNNASSAGGGMWVSDTATLTKSTVSGNAAGSSGGGIQAFATTLTNSTVSGNSAATVGGGISVNIAVGTANLTNSTVSGNSAGNNGGGILAVTANLTTTTASGNTAGSNGGGIWATTATLLNCTIVENIGQTGGGVFHIGGGTFNVRNTIVALNLVEFGGTGPDVSGAFTSPGHNLIGDSTGSTGFTDGVSGDIVGTPANPIDPKLGPLANNGGRTRTHALLAGSRAIDAGDNSILPPTDQRGFPRRKDGNGDGVAIVDIGAFER